MPRRWRCPPPSPRRRCRPGARLVRRLARGAAGVARAPCGASLTGPGAHRGPAHDGGARAGLAGARSLADGVLLLEDGGRRGAGGAADGDARRAARLEIFNNLFMHIAEQMGEVLKSTAQSVNIRERLDYSCALFDAGGGLVANAPHMPVHLGSMGASVRAVMRGAAADGPRATPCSLNSPYHGGTHLPDMTVVTPVFLAGTAPAGFLRRLARPPRRHRRHHARLHAAVQPPHRGGRHPVRVLRAGQRRHAARARGARARSPADPSPPAVRSRTSPTCARSSRPTRAGSWSSSAPRSVTAWRPCMPSWRRCRTTPPPACGARSRP